MASIYRKNKSPFWFIQFIDADGTRRNKSTDKFVVSSRHSHKKKG